MMRGSGVDMGLWGFVLLRFVGVIAQPIIVTGFMRIGNPRNSIISMTTLKMH